MATSAPPSGSAGFPIVGRAAELAAISALVEGAREGRGGFLFLLGEAGIGKTTLMRHTAASMSDVTTVVSVRGIEAESELGYAGLVDVLRPLLEHLDALVPAQRAVLEGVLGLGPTTPADPLATSAAALALLAAAADDSTVLMTVDDFHWLEPPLANPITYRP